MRGPHPSCAWKAKANRSPSCCGGVWPNRSTWRRARWVTRRSVTHWRLPQSFPEPSQRVERLQGGHPPEQSTPHHRSPRHEWWSQLTDKNEPQLSSPRHHAARPKHPAGCAHFYPRTGHKRLLSRHIQTRGSRRRGDERRPDHRARVHHPTPKLDMIISRQPIIRLRRAKEQI